MIYLISPERIACIHMFAKQLEAILLLECRPEIFQLRLKNQNNVEECIKHLLPLCKKYAVEFILNDDIALAQKYNIGVHVGKDTELSAITEFKKNTGNKVGVSCYNEINRALQFENIADYISFGAVFASNTKPSAVVCEHNIIIEFSQKSKKDIAIIGGICEETLPELTGILPLVRYICVLSCVW